MKKFHSLSDSETEIMKVIWELAIPVSISQLLPIFKNKNWKTQTMATFLKRLADKGFITITQQAKRNLYSPTVTEEEYHQLEAQGILDSMYSGSLQSFISTLYCGSKMDEKEIESIKKWFEKVSTDG